MTAIYKGVGNSDVREMTQQYFPDMSYYGRTTIFGFLVGSSPIFEMRETELIIASSIMSLGATRQAKSHVKCCVVVGNGQDTVVAMVNTVRQVAAWNGKPLVGEFDVAQLASEIQR